MIFTFDSINKELKIKIGNNEKLFGFDLTDECKIKLKFTTLSGSEIHNDSYQVSNFFLLKINLT